jgi:hypothetical protein
MASVDKQTEDSAVSVVFPFPLLINRASGKLFTTTNASGKRLTVAVRLLHDLVLTQRFAGANNQFSGVASTKCCRLQRDGYLSRCDCSREKRSGEVDGSNSGRPARRTCDFRKKTMARMSAMNPVSHINEGSGKTSCSVWPETVIRAESWSAESDVPLDGASAIFIDDESAIKVLPSDCLKLSWFNVAVNEADEMLVSPGTCKMSGV